MSDDRFVEAQKHHPLSIRRNVREPVVVVVGKYLRLLAPVGLHSPNLHVPGALGIGIDVLTVRRIFRPVVETLGGGQASFFAAVDGYGVNVKLAVALAHESESFSV